MSDNDLSPAGYRGNILDLVDQLDNSIAAPFVSGEICNRSFGPDEAVLKRMIAGPFAKRWSRIIDEMMKNADDVFKHLNVLTYGDNDATAQLSDREDVRYVLSAIGRLTATEDFYGVRQYFAQFHGNKIRLSEADKKVLLDALQLRFAQALVEEHERRRKAFDESLVRINQCLTHGE